jgi:hypothetical protein
MPPITNWLWAVVAILAIIALAIWIAGHVTVQ